jgi:hypothetical protein
VLIRSRKGDGRRENEVNTLVNIYFHAKIWRVSVGDGNAFRKPRLGSEKDNELFNEKHIS